MPMNLNALLQDVPMEARPMFRYWFPPNETLDMDAIRRDMREIAENGFGGVELKCEGGHADVVELGTERWQEAMTAAMQECASLGIRADFGNTAGQFIDTPAIASLEDPGAAQELDFSTIRLPGNHPGTVQVRIPEPEQPAPMKGPNIRTAHSLVCVTTGALRPDGLLDSCSLNDITERCEICGDQFLWSVPDDRSWQVFFHWKRARNETQPTRIADGSIANLPLLDFFNAEASKAFITHWLRVLMTPRMRELAADMNSCMFSDNVENSWTRLQWSDSTEIFKTFRDMHGYALSPYLPLLYRDGGGFVPESEPLYHTEDRRLSSRVFADYCETMTELYIRNYLIPVREALSRAGMRFRVQTPYGSLRQEQTIPACHVDIPETESLWMGDSVDGYRAAAGAVHMSGKQIYSSEIGAVMGESNRQTWLHLCHQVEKNIMGGVNLSILHGYGYSGPHPKAQWPGWSCMAPQFSNDWGPRSPQWIHAPQFAAYVGRMQALTQWGKPVVDVAVLRLCYKTPRNPGPTEADGMFSSDCLTAAGFTYEYVSPGLIRQYHFPYRALLVPGPSLLDTRVQKAVEKLIAAGTPVLVYGSSEGRVSEGAIRIESADRCAEKLLALGITPAAHYQEPMPQLLSVCRTDGDYRVFLFYNLREAPLQGTVCLSGRQAGRMIDLWTGSETERFGKIQNGTLHLTLPGNGMVAVLADGHIQQADIPGQSATVIPNQWSFRLDRWIPGKDSHLSEHTVFDCTLSSVIPWSSIPGLEHAVGIGTYRAEFTLQTPIRQAILKVKTACDLFSVTVNGASVPVNPVLGIAEIGSRLRSGTNHIEIQSASPLFNQLAEQFPEQYGKMQGMDGTAIIIPHQSYGIICAEIEYC